MSCPLPPPPVFVPSTTPSVFAPAPPTSEGAAHAGATCVVIGDIMADLLSTRVCPIVYRQAWLQGKVPPPPPFLRAWCDRRVVAEPDAPTARPRFYRVGLRAALRDALDALRLRRAGA